MDPERKMLIILLSSPLIIFVTHILLMRLFSNTSPQIITIKSAFLGYLPTGLLLYKFVFCTFPFTFTLILLMFYCFIIYTSLAYTYFHFFNLSETGRRIRILYEIYKAGSLPLRDITSLYKLSDIIDIRLKRLIAMKQLKYTDGYYSLDGKILYYMALLVSLWRNILGLTKNYK